MQAPGPTFTFRGSEDAVTAVCCSQDTFFVTGDASGNLAIWDWLSKRRKLAWKAHDAQILALYVDPTDTSLIISQGRDHLIHFWRFTGAEMRVEKERSVPFHSLTFCRMSILQLSRNEGEGREMQDRRYLLALPSSDATGCDVLLLSSSTLFKRYTDIGPCQNDKKGMATSLCILPQSSPSEILLAAGFESGDVYIYQIGENGGYTLIDSLGCFAEPGMIV